jgi:outer membrane receptor protein involved in Fe transport
MIAIGLAWLSGTAFAAAVENPAHTEQAGVIIVTGERVARPLRDTASSVDVWDATRLEALSGANRIEQVLELIPNLQLGSGGEGPTIRGQDTTGVLRDLPGFLGGSRPRTTLQVDGRAVSFNEFIFGSAPLWDIDRVEVFRTPQTTTQGRNSIAGAIFIFSEDPTYQWEARGRLLAGNYDVRQGSAVVSGPLVGDQLAFRLAADVRRGRPSSKIVDVTRGADPNNDDHSLLRFKLLAEPNVWPGSRLEVTYVHSRSLSPQVEGIRPPFRERRDPVDRYGTFAVRTDSVTAVADTPVAEDLTATTTLSYGSSYARRYALAGFGEAKNRVRDGSVETILNWAPDGRSRILGGLYYFGSRLDQLIDLSLGAGIGEFDDKQSSVGIFGETTFDLAPGTAVNAGLRYQRDRQKRVGQLGRPELTVSLDYDRTFWAWLPKFSVTQAIGEDARAGILIQRAYNPGGATLRFDTGLPEEFRAESLWNHELFVRVPAARSIRLAANLFYTRIRGSQRARSVSFQPPGAPGPITFASIANEPRARSFGAELTSEWEPTERLSARVAVGLLKTKIVRTENADSLALGKAFQRSPPLTAMVSVDWQPVPSLRLSAQVRHNSRYYGDDFETPEFHIGRAAIAEARAGWTNGGVTLFSYVRNLLNAFALRSQSTPTFATAVDPREVGLGIAARL